MADDDSASLAHGRPELGFSTRYAQLLVVGAALVVLGGFLVNLSVTSDHPSEEMMDMAQWAIWLGTVTVSVSLLLAGVTGATTSPGLRTALILGGAYLLLTQSANAGFLSTLFRF